MNGKPPGRSYRCKGGFDRGRKVLKPMPVRSFGGCRGGHRCGCVRGELRRGGHRHVRRRGGFRWSGDRRVRGRREPCRGGRRCVRRRQGGIGSCGGSGRVGRGMHGSAGRGGSSRGGGVICGDGGRRGSGKLCGDGSWCGSEHRNVGGRGRVERSGRAGGCGGEGPRGRQRWQVQRLADVDDIAIQAIGSSDGVNTHAKTQRKRVESVSWSHNVHNPAKRWATGIGPWSGTGIKGRRQVNLLTRIDSRCTQTVGSHKRKGGDASSPSQSGERFTLLYGIGEPTRRPRTTGHQGQR
jgi:hypothetical protein